MICIKKVFIGIVVVIVLGVLAVIFLKAPDGDSLLTEFMEMKGSSDQAETSGMTTPLVSESPAMNGTADANVKEFSVDGSNFKFVPAALSVNKGDTVKITFMNTGGMHDFVIDEFNAKTKRISTDESETITFVVDKAGVFEYYCSVGNHRQMGMKGTLTVQ